MPQAYGIGGLVNVPAGPVEGRGAPSSSFRGQIGQQYFDMSTSPPTQYIYNGQTWQLGGNGQATETVAGIARIATAAEATTGTDDTTIMTPAKVALIAIAGAPDATEITKGIAMLATTAEAQAGANDTDIMTPLKVFQALATPPAIGSTTPAAGTFTDLTADGTGTVSLGANAASNVTVTGAFDLTLASTAGSLVVNAGEAAADAIDLNAASGGIDIDVALLASITSTRNNAQAILLEATAGGIDILASGAAAGEDIDITATGSSVNISASENVADAIVLNASAGGIDITAAGAAGEDIDIVNTAGSININAGEAVADAINIDSSGGVDLDAAGQVNIASSQNAADAIVITSSAGGIDILAPAAAAGEDIDIVATGSSVNISATENVADSITIVSTAGGIDIFASGASAGEDIDIVATGSSVNIESTEDAALAIYLHANGGTSETIRLRADQGTGAASVDILSDVGGVTITGGLGTADAINIVASDVAGGIDVDAGTGGVIVDTTGAFSIDGAAASNITVTGAGIDLTLSSSGGSVLVESTEDAANAIRLHANGGVSETIQIHADQGTGVSSVNLLSDVGGITLRAAGLASADAINLEAVAGGIDMDSALLMSLTSTRDNAQAILVEATLGGIDILASGAAAGEDIDIVATGSSVNIQSTESAADSITIVSTAGGIDILASGAAAGEDIDIVATGSSVNITSTENVSDAIVINASGAASGVSIDAGTSGITFGTGLVKSVTSVATAATPYAVLGTDYFITTDSTAGVLTITLPAAPATGRTVIVYDGVGQGAANNVTIDGNGKNIAAGGTSAATKVINTAYESYILTYNGTLWCGQNIV